MVPYDYYYAGLNNAEKSVYNDIYKGLINFKREIKTGPLKDVETNLPKVLKALSFDKQDIYHYSGAYKYYYQENVGVTMYPDYQLTGEEKERLDPLLEKEAERVVKLVREQAGEDQEAVVKALYEYAAQHFTYDFEVAGIPNYEAAKKLPIRERFVQCHSVIGPLTEGRVVCDAVARFFQLILTEMGIFCIYEEGNSSEFKNPGEGLHAWNIVGINGKTYQLDATWTLPEQDGVRETYYGYLSVSDKEIRKDHWNFKNVPECPYDDLDYYRTRGIEFASMETLVGYLRKVVRTGTEVAEFKLVNDPDRKGFNASDGIQYVVDKAYRELAKIPGTFRQASWSYRAKKRTCKMTFEYFPEYLKKLAGEGIRPVVIQKLQERPAEITQEEKQRLALEKQRLEEIEAREKEQLLALERAQAELVKKRWDVLKAPRCVSDAYTREDMDYLKVDGMIYLLNNLTESIKCGRELFAFKMVFGEEIGMFDVGQTLKSVLERAMKTIQKDAGIPADITYSYSEKEKLAKVTFNYQ